MTDDEKEKLKGDVMDDDAVKRNKKAYANRREYGSRLTTRVVTGSVAGCTATGAGVKLSVAAVAQNFYGAMAKLSGVFMNAVSLNGKAVAANGENYTGHSKAALMFNPLAAAESGKELTVCRINAASIKIDALKMCP